MTQRNSTVGNVRNCYIAAPKAAINGYRNIVFLPGVGRFKGTWKNNLREGHGTLINKNGIIYEGNWKNDKRHGYGLLQRKLRSKRVSYEPLYDGQWRFDKKHGDGTAYYENGIYEGQWMNDCREGLGTMWFHDGSYYIGEWKKNLFDGSGAHFGFNYVISIVHFQVRHFNLDVKGTVYKGYFQNGTKCGEGSMYYLPERKIQKGIWVDGCCVTSVLQDNVEKVLPSKRDIPEIGLSNPVKVVDESLRIICRQQELLKLRQKRIENFNKF